MSTSPLQECRIIDLPRHGSERGSLTELQNDNRLPFAIRRVFYIYDVPGDVERGAHAHSEQSELIVAASGSFDVVLSDGAETRTFTLRRPYKGLYVPPGVWLQMRNFSSGVAVLVMGSDKFNEDDNIRDYDQYLKLRAKG